MNGLVRSQLFTTKAPDSGSKLIIKPSMIELFHLIFYFLRKKIGLRILSEMSCTKFSM